VVPKSNQRTPRKKPAGPIEGGEARRSGSPDRHLLGPLATHPWAAEGGRTLRFPSWPPGKRGPARHVWGSEFAAPALPSLGHGPHAVSGLSSCLQMADTDSPLLERLPPENLDDAELEHELDIAAVAIGRLRFDRYQELLAEAERRSLLGD